MDKSKEAKSEVTEDEAITNRTSGLKILLEALDIVLYFFIIGPCVVCYWRGTWELLEFYYPPQMWVAGWISYVLGIVGLSLCSFLQVELMTLVKDKHTAVYILFTRVYLYIIGFLSVNHWHGVWKIWDNYSGVSAISGIASAVIGVIIMVLLKAANHVNAPPLAFGMDTSDTMFKITTRFGCTRKDGHRYVLDTLLTVIVIHGAVVFVWRGTWVALDALLFPDSLFWSAITSAVAGYSICVIYSIMQIPAAMLHKKLNDKSWLQLLFSQLYWIVAFLGPVNVWRGCWMLLDQFFLADHKPLSQWVTHLIGCSLMLVMTYKCIPVVGYIPDGSTVSLKIDFLQEIFLSSTKPWNRKREPISEEDESRERSNGVLLNKMTDKPVESTTGDA